tara:strand:+ start:414 stop:737 length:324 start_codon:yes stop_codon:yes gene_type:complete
MTTTTQQIIDEFTTLIDTEKEYTRSELGKILTGVYHQITSGKKNAEPKKKKSKKEVDDDAPPKKKREPTAYNLFVKEKMPIIKEEFPELSRQDLMKKVGELWKVQKE